MLDMDSHKNTKADLDNPKAFKHLFGESLLKRIADSIYNFYPSFNRKRFIKLSSELIPLEMKPRVWLIRNELRALLPNYYTEAVNILLKSTSDGTLSGFDLWPYTEFVQTYGLDDPELSLNVLKKFTAIFTSEWAVRPFLKHYPDKTLLFLLRCCEDSDVHVRRWASEGSRPRLPWGERLHNFIRDPTHTVKILEKLKFDSELFVRKSVANHLNDIAKDHPEHVIAILKDWKQSAKEVELERLNWVIYRALRTLIKAGNPKALKLIGVSHAASIKLQKFRIIKERITLGETLEFEIQLCSKAARPQKLVIDYIMHFVKSNKKTAPKVFKLRTLKIAAKGVMIIKKSHRIKNITTRLYYAGVQHLEIQVNGKVLGKASWNLRIS